MTNYDEGVPQSAVRNGRGAKRGTFPLFILISALIISSTWIYTKKINGDKFNYQASIKAETESGKIENKVLPKEGVVLPVKWGDLGIKIVGSGALDLSKMEAIYGERGEKFPEDIRKILTENSVGQIKIDPNNSNMLLNIFWALGLGNKNQILEQGEMSNPEYGGAGNFASTGGWTLAVGNAMNHYSRHPFILLTPEQQNMVEEISKNIYRPCCNNATHFPDCNHGMAMLGVLELLAANGANREEIYKIALQINSYWFPDTYLTIAKFLQAKGVDWKNVNPKEILGFSYSSYSGYKNIQSQTAPEAPRGGGCGV